MYGECFERIILKSSIKIYKKPIERICFFSTISELQKEKKAFSPAGGHLLPASLHHIRKLNCNTPFIAGERRLRAIKDYTDMTNIQAQIASVDDLQANEKALQKTF